MLPHDLCVSSQVTAALLCFNLYLAASGITMYECMKGKSRLQREEQAAGFVPRRMGARGPMDVLRNLRSFCCAGFLTSE